MLNIKELIYFKNYIFLYIFLLPFTYFGSQLGILTAILIVWWIFELKNNRAYYILKMKEFFTFNATLCISLFLMFACLSYFWSDNKVEAMSVINSYKYFFILLPIIFSSLNKDDALHALKILGISFSLYGIGSLLIYIELFEWSENSPKNPQFLFRYMITGIYLVWGTVILYYFYLTESMNKIKFVYFFLSLVCLVGVFVNNGRAAQLALAVTLAVIFIVNMQKIKFEKKNILIFCIVTIMLLIVLKSQDHLILRYQNEFKAMISYDSENSYASSWGQRLKMYTIGYDLMQVEPIAGVGAGDFKDIFHEYVRKHNIKLTWMYNTIHNIYIEYFTKYGVIGFLLFIGSFLFLFFSFLRSQYRNLALTIIVPLSIVFCFDSILVYKPFNNVFIMIFTLLSVIGNSIYRQRRIG